MTPGELGKRALLHHPCIPPFTTICSGFVTSSASISGSSHEVSSFMTRAESVRQRHRQTGVDRERDDHQLKRAPEPQSMRETSRVAPRHVSPHVSGVRTPKYKQKPRNDVLQMMSKQAMSRLAEKYILRVETNRLGWVEAGGCSPRFSACHAPIVDLEAPSPADSRRCNEYIKP